MSGMEWTMMTRRVIDIGYAALSLVTRKQQADDLTVSCFTFRTKVKTQKVAAAELPLRPVDRILDVTSPEA